MTPDHEDNRPASVPQPPIFVPPESETRPEAAEMPFTFGVRKDESIWCSYGTIGPGEKHCMGDIPWPMWALEDLKRRLDEQAGLRALLTQSVSRIQEMDGESPLVKAIMKAL